MPIGDNFLSPLMSLLMNPQARDAAAGQLAMHMTPPNVGGATGGAPQLNIDTSQLDTPQQPSFSQRLAMMGSTPGAAGAIQGLTGGAPQTPPRPLASPGGIGNRGAVQTLFPANAAPPQLLGIPSFASFINPVGR